MPVSSEVSPLLTDAPPGSHFAQLHPDPDVLAANVSLFLEIGLRRGAGVAVLAASGNLELFLDRLARRGLDPEPYLRSGQLDPRNAEELLPDIMRGDMPHSGDFRRVMGEIFDGLLGWSGDTLRVYGELVGVLWRSGRPDAAIRLEEYWNELARHHPFAKFCGFPVDSYCEATYAEPIHEIGRTHSRILMTEEEERFRAAVDVASQEVLGIPLSQVLHHSRQDECFGEDRLCRGHRTMLWIQRNMPSSSGAILALARQHAEQRAGPAVAAR